MATEKKPATMEERLLAIRLRKEELELENLEYQVTNLRQAKETRQRSAEQNELTLKETREGERMKWENCNHRSGGEGMDALMTGQGADTNYCVIKNTYPWGETRVQCQRCGCEWKPGDKAETHPSGISYKAALNLPTWNKPSGTTIFLIPRKPRPEKAA